jgi:hypothetical protein
MTDPTEDIPPNRPLGKRDCGFEFRAFRLGVPGAGGIGTVVKPANQLYRALECIKATIPVVADMHHTPTGRATAIKDVELPEREIRILGPNVWHPASLHAALWSIN